MRYSMIIEEERRKAGKRVESNKLSQNSKMNGPLKFVEKDEMNRIKRKGKKQILKNQNETDCENIRKQ